MAGFSKIYIIGGLGGFQGADGVNPILMQIWVGDSSRQWLEPHYLDGSIKPIGKLRSLVPAGPDHPHALLDACIAFFPKQFEKCPSLAGVTRELALADMLDFDMGLAKIPSGWNQLRAEAWPLFGELNIWEADLRRLGPPEKLP